MFDIVETLKPTSDSSSSLMHLACVLLAKHNVNQIIVNKKAGTIDVNWVRSAEDITSLSIISEDESTFDEDMFIEKTAYTELEIVEVNDSLAAQFTKALGQLFSEGLVPCWIVCNQRSLRLFSKMLCIPFKSIKDKNKLTNPASYHVANYNVIVGSDKLLPGNKILVCGALNNSADIYDCKVSIMLDGSLNGN